MGNENASLNYYFFFLYRDAIDMEGLESAYDYILELFDREQKVGEMISSIEREENVAKYYAERSLESCYGICEILREESPDSQDEDFTRIEICERDVVAAAQLFSRVLESAGLFRNFRVEGHDREQKCRFVLEYALEQSTLYVNRFYDNVEYVDHQIECVNRRFNTSFKRGFDGGWYACFPKDDEETLDCFRHLCVDDMFDMSTDYFRDALAANPPKTYEDLLNIWIDVVLEEDDHEKCRLFADQQCSISYALAYLKVHYDVEPDVSVKIHEL